MYLVLHRVNLGASYFLRSIIHDSTDNDAKFYRLPHYCGDNTGDITSQWMSRGETLEFIKEVI